VKDQLLAVPPEPSPPSAGPPLDNTYRALGKAGRDGLGGEVGATLSLFRFKISKTSDRLTGDVRTPTSFAAPYVLIAERQPSGLGVTWARRARVTGTESSIRQVLMKWFSCAPRPGRACSDSTKTIVGIWPQVHSTQRAATSPVKFAG
jgi:hypothetical protein